MQETNLAVISAKLQSIQKLGEYFRVHYPDWRIVLLSPDWREDNGLFMREIYHEGKGKILAFARVEVPEETFFRFHVELQNLGDRSIGDHFLFVKDDVVREEIEVFDLNTPHPAHCCQALLASPADRPLGAQSFALSLKGRGDFSFARRSKFWVEGYPLTITEYFTSEGLQCLLD